MNDITQVFSSPVIVDVLKMLLLNSDQEYYQSEIVKETGYAQIQIQRVLEKLCVSGLVLKTKKGRMVYYRANENHVGFDDLKNFMMKTVGFVGILSNVIIEFGEDINFAFIYGSIASGKETYESDIDLFLITGLSLRKLLNKIGPVSRNFKRELNVSCYSLEEFIRKFKKDDHFITTVLSKPKIFLKGDENELEKILV